MDTLILRIRLPLLAWLHLRSPRPECVGHVCGNIIYQLGLLILELITGQSSDERGAELIQWVQQSCSSASMHNMIDPDLGNSYNSRELRGLLAVARMCTNSVDRPSSFTPQIYRYLQKKVGINEVH